MCASKLTSKMEVLWADQAKKIPWFSPWNNVLEWDEPFAKWFAGGTLNASYACLDVHINSWRKNKVALYCENEDGKTISISYLQLYKEVNKCASALRNLGVKKGDRIILYLPMISQAIVSMLAAARLGAVHSVVFSAFGAKALAERIEDAQARFIITADFGKRRGKLVSLKSVVDSALEQTECVEKVVVVKRTDEVISFNEERDVWYNDILQHADAYIEPEKVDATHPLFILYTSGTTGKPKGIVHSTGGYLVYVFSTYQWAFNPNDESTYWCTADIGWITGHSFVTYAPLLHGSSLVLYEGAPDYPNIERWWSIIEKYSVSIFYTSPTALRMFMRYGDEPIKKYDLSSLQVLGSVGEVINPEVWEWYRKHIGAGKCPIVDTWWQTETGGFMIAPSTNLGLVDLRPGSATFPLPGIDADVVDESGNSVSHDSKGFLVIKRPWPGMLMGVYNNDERYKKVYWSKFKGMYYTGDYAIKDKDGYFWLLGRSDEALNVAGHMLGTSEIESAAVTVPLVAEAAVARIKDELKGDAIALFVVLKKGESPSDAVKKDIIQSIRTHVGAIAKPKEIYFVDMLPKTRSGKIMRRILRSIANGETIGDVSTLENEASVEEAKLAYSSFKKTMEKIVNL